MNVILSLLQSYCTPILMYNLDAISLNKSTVTRLANTFNRTYFKIFKTFDLKVILQCMYYFGYLPFEYELDLRKINFLHKLKCSKNCILKLLLHKVGGNDYEKLCSKYNSSVYDSLFILKRKIFSSFESSVN